MYDESTDGDFAKRPQGGNDAMLLTYDWREKPVDTSALVRLPSSRQVAWQKPITRRKAGQFSRRS